MKRTFVGRILCWATLASLAVALAAATQPAWGADAPVKKIRRSRGRLPAYYEHVVSPEQRDKIYKIQEEYKPKIGALEAQLKDLKKQRDEKIAAVLTAEQKKQVEEAAKKSKEKPAKPAETAPPASPTGDTPAK